MVFRMIHSTENRVGRKYTFERTFEADHNARDYSVGTEHVAIYKQLYIVAMTEDGGTEKDMNGQRKTNDKEERSLLKS